jgi:hypothetical protein
MNGPAAQDVPLQEISAPVPHVWNFDPRRSFDASHSLAHGADAIQAVAFSHPPGGQPTHTHDSAQTAAGVEKDKESLLLAPVIPSAEWNVVQKRVSDLRTAFSVLQQTVVSLQDQVGASRP